MVETEKTVEDPDKEEKGKSVLDREEKIHNKAAAAIEISLRLIESDMNPVLSDKAAVAFNNFCYEALDDLDLLLTEYWDKVRK